MCQNLSPTRDPGLHPVVSEDRNVSYDTHTRVISTEQPRHRPEQWGR